MTLDQLSIGESGRVLSVGGDKALRRHFLDMGITPGTIVTLVKVAPMGDPLEISVRGYELTLRGEDAGRIGIERALAERSEARKDARHREIAHPHIGERGEHKPSEKPLIPESMPITR